MYRKGYMPHLNNLYTGYNTYGRYGTEYKNTMNAATTSDKRKPFS